MGMGVDKARADHFSGNIHHAPGLGLPERANVCNAVAGDADINALRGLTSAVEHHSIDQGDIEHGPLPSSRRRRGSRPGGTGRRISACQEFHDVLLDLSLIHISEPTRPY